MHKRELQVRLYVVDFKVVFEGRDVFEQFIDLLLLLLELSVEFLLEFWKRIDLAIHVRVVTLSTVQELVGVAEFVYCE